MVQVRLDLAVTDVSEVQLKRHRRVRHALTPDLGRHSSSEPIDPLTLESFHRPINASNVRALFT